MRDRPGDRGFPPVAGAVKMPLASPYTNTRRTMMAISMYHASVPVFLQLLGGLKGTLDKAQKYAAEKKWDEATVLNLRLYPDMFTLARQVRQASEHAFGAGRAAGVAVPELPPIDNSWAEMQSRLDKTIDFLKGLRPDQLDGKEDTQVTLVQGGQPRHFRAQVYLYHLAMPNFYFHTTTAYNILRSLGIEIGKRDFMGPMPT
jgi:hypothetical protein